MPISQAAPLAIGSRCSAPFRHNDSPSCTAPLTYSSSPLGSKVMAWPILKPLHTAFRWSAPAPGPYLIRYPPALGCSSHPTTHVHWHRRFAVSSAIQMNDDVLPPSRARLRASFQPGTIPRRFLLTRSRPWRDQLFRRLAGAARATRFTRAQSVYPSRNGCFAQTSSLRADHRSCLWHGLDAAED